MPRKQLDILKDLFIAYRDESKEAFLKHADEYVRYLDWKKFPFKAREFETIIQQIRQKENTGAWKEPFGDRTIEHTLFGDEVVKKPYPKAEKSPYVWQISKGAQVDFMQASVLLEHSIKLEKKQYAVSDFPAITGYSHDKTEGFLRILYFLGLLNDKSRSPSKLAVLMMQHDKYFEDIGTLWFLHYFIASDSRLIIWNRLANFLFCKQEFNYDDVLNLMEDQRSSHSAQAFAMHLRKEFNTCTKAYTDSNFTKLNILTAKASSFQKSQAFLVPDEILLAAIWLFKQRCFPFEVTLEIKSLAGAENSPGRLFYLTERYLRDALDRLRMKGYIAIESLADLDQIKFTAFSGYLDVLSVYYTNKFS